MAWTTPRTWVASEIVTAAQLNANVRDNLLVLATDIDTSTGSINRAKRLTTNTTQVGNIGGGEDDLMTYSLAAGTLATNGQVARVSAQFTFAANTNTKTLKFYFGSTAISLAGSSINGQSAIVDIDIVRIGATSQSIFVRYLQTNNGNTAGTSASSATETLSGALTLKFTGQSGASASNDVIQGYMMVTFLN